MSTISTQLNWGVGMLVNDALLPLSKKKIEDKKQVYYGRIFTVLLALASMVLVNFIEEIKTVWDFVMQCGAGLGFVLIARWLWWRINAWTEIVATITPFVVYGINNAFLADAYPTLAKPVYENPSGFVLSVGITVVASLITIFVTKPTANEKLASFAEKVKPMGVWGKFNTNEDKGNELLLSIGLWLFAVIMSYSLLFVISDLIFQNWENFMPKLLVLLVSFGVFVWLSKIYNQKHLPKE